MGLGKTLSILALVCWSLDSVWEDAGLEGGEPARRSSTTTLVVAPNSSMPSLWRDPFYCLIVYSHTQLGAAIGEVSLPFCCGDGLNWSLGILIPVW